jgi:C4-dicarboxylate-specific signal transduction histidine kinase
MSDPQSIGIPSAAVSHEESIEAATETREFATIMRNILRANQRQEVRQHAAQINEQIERAVLLMRAIMHQVILRAREQGRIAVDDYVADARLSNFEMEALLEAADRMCRELAGLGYQSDLFVEEGGRILRYQISW